MVRGRYRQSDDQISRILQSKPRRTPELRYKSILSSLFAQSQRMPVGFISTAATFSSLENAKINGERFYFFLAGGRRSPKDLAAAGQIFLPRPGTARGCAEVPPPRGRPAPASVDG